MDVCNLAPVCRANCSVATQWALADTGQIQADADIVGAGVIISFVVTAHITFLVIVIGYLTFSFDSNCTNRADDKIVESTRRFIGRFYQSLVRCHRWLPLRPGMKRTSGTGPVLTSPMAEDSPKRKYRIDTFRGFMLALSDQQLVTGLAMLVAALGRWGEITIYSANVVSALAFFSNSVHMGTLDFLTTYLRRHGIVKGCRAVAMTLTMVLLVFIMSMQLSSTWWVDPETSNLFVVCGFWDFSIQWATLDDLGEALTQLYVMVLVAFSHFDKISTLYSTEGQLPQGEDGFTRSCLTKHNVKKFDYRITVYKQQAQEIIKQDPSWRRTLKSWKLVESFAFHETHDSRVWQIALLLYSNIYGAILIFRYRNESEGTVGPFNTMGFGQIVPVFLLALLMFAAAESIYGYRDALEDNTSNKTVAQVTKTAHFSYNTLTSESFNASNPDVVGVQEFNVQHAEVQPVGVDDQPENISMGDSVVGLSVPQVEGTNLILVAETEASTQSEDVAEVSRTSNRSTEEVLVGAKHQARDQNSQEVFHLQSIDRTSSTGVDLPFSSRKYLSGQVHATPSERRTQATSDRASLRTLSDIALADVNSKDIISLGDYGNPRRVDTESRIGIQPSNAQNVAYEDPKSLLARLIRHDMFEVPEVHTAILLYALLILVLQAILACAAGLLLGSIALILSFWVVLMEIRHWWDVWGRLQRIKALANNNIDHSASLAAPHHTTSTT